jgi:hypothetical protein
MLFVVQKVGVGAGNAGTRKRTTLLSPVDRLTFPFHSNFTLLPAVLPHQSSTIQELITTSSGL